MSRRDTWVRRIITIVFPYTPLRSSSKHQIHQVAQVIHIQFGPALVPSILWSRLSSLSILHLPEECGHDGSRSGRLVQPGRMALTLGISLRKSWQHGQQQWNIASFRWGPDMNWYWSADLLDQISWGNSSCMARTGGSPVKYAWKAKEYKYGVKDAFLTAWMNGKSMVKSKPFVWVAEISNSNSSYQIYPIIQSCYQAKWSFILLEAPASVGAIFDCSWCTARRKSMAACHTWPSRSWSLPQLGRSSTASLAHKSLAIHHKYHLPKCLSEYHPGATFQHQRHTFQHFHQTVERYHLHKKAFANLGQSYISSCMSKSTQATSNNCGNLHSDVLPAACIVTCPNDCIPWWTDGLQAVSATEATVSQCN